MKFVNGTNAGARRRGDNSEHPYGRKIAAPAPPPVLPTPFNPNQDLKELLKVMKPEPKALLESKMLRASQNVGVEQIKRETEDILAVLRNLYKK